MTSSWFLMERRGLIFLISDAQPGIRVWFTFTVNESRIHLVIYWAWPWPNLIQYHMHSFEDLHLPTWHIRKLTSWIRSSVHSPPTHYGFNANHSMLYAEQTIGHDDMCRKNWYLLLGYPHFLCGKNTCCSVTKLHIMASSSIVQPPLL